MIDTPEVVVLKLRKLNSFSGLDRYRKQITRGRDGLKKTVSVCAGTGCRACGSMELHHALTEEISNRKLFSQVEIKATGCQGFCEQGPLMTIQPGNILYLRVEPEDIPEIITETIQNGNPVERLLYQDPAEGRGVSSIEEIPFFARQERVVFGDNSLIDPFDIRDYIAIGGYSALSAALKDLTPIKVINMIEKSGLRGRGGGGFPAGVKWRSARRAKGDRKFVVCNADEGDPGAFMDRSICEGNPHAIIEGMIIGAFAVGSSEGYIYVRDEYPLAVKTLGSAIEQARECGILGDRILGTEHSFDIEIVKGGGAFVCGESTALMASIEGRVGEPRAKYVHTVERGLWDCPTVLNNVETWATVGKIIRRGVEWFTSMGTGDVRNNPWGGSKGTKIFSLVGNINNTGLVEVPMGMTLREIIYHIGGGIPGGKEFKAVQTGGPSGGCLPATQLNLPVDFDRLTGAGSMMGSGGMIVMDEDTCMVDVARYFIDFLKGESCGKCLPCREGLRNLLEILTRITEGRGRPRDISLLRELSETIAETSLCALGSTAPNPVLSTLNYFEDEYKAHINDKRCPAGVCRALVSYSIDEQKCTGCHACVRVCPTDCITGEPGEVHRIDRDACVKCGSCYQVCKFDAVSR